MQDYLADALKIPELGRTMILTLRYENKTHYENKTLKDFTLDDYIAGAEALLLVVEDDTLPLYATEEDNEPRKYTPQERQHLAQVLHDYLDKYKIKE